VIWRALNGRQTQFSEGDDRARRYTADVAPFAGLLDLSPASFASLVSLVPRGDQVAMFTVEPLPPTEQLEIVLAKPEEPATPMPEVGWGPVNFPFPGGTEPIVMGMIDGAMMFHWHFDTFDLPKLPGPANPAISRCACGLALTSVMRSSLISPT